MNDRSAIGRFRTAEGFDSGGGGGAWKRNSNGAAVFTTRPGGAASLEPSCNGVPAFDSRRKELWLTRNSANRPNAQLMPRIEASTATTIRRKFGNIRPRERPARSANHYGPSRPKRHELVNHGREIVVRVGAGQSHSPAPARLAESGESTKLKISPKNEARKMSLGGIQTAPLQVEKSTRALTHQLPTRWRPARPVWRRAGLLRADLCHN